MAGKVLSGPSLVLVGEGRDGSGLRNRTAEVAYLSPGSVVAPWPYVRPPTKQDAKMAIMAQLRSTIPGAAEGARITAKKARKILRDGTIRGHPLTEKQRRFFGAVAGGQKLYSAATGITAGIRTIPANLMAAYTARRSRAKAKEENVSTPTPEPAPPPAPPPAPEPQLPSPAQLDALRKEATAAVGTPIMQFLRNPGQQYNVLSGGTPEVRQLFSSGLPTYYDIRRMSPTQMGALQSLLAANEIRPEDFMAAIQRDFSGFAPGVAPGQRARILRYIH